MAQNRTIVVGDIHGMDLELNALLNALTPQAGDTVVLVGDLLDKGPESAKVVRILRELRESGIEVILVGGNHEAKHALFRPMHAKGKGKGMKGFGELAQLSGDLSDEDIAFLETAVLFHRLPEHNALVVHAGIPGTLTELPEVAPGLDGDLGRLGQILRVRHITAKAETRLVVEITAPVEFTADMTVAELASAGTVSIKSQVVKPVGSFIKLGDNTPEDPFWADVHDGRFGHVFFGHSPFVGDKPTWFPHATGLDTGCVFGGSLTAAVLVVGEETTFVSVPAVAREGWEFPKTLHEE